MYVEAFTNRTYPSERLAGFLPGDAAYAPGDELELCYAARRPDLAGVGPEEIAQEIFEELNRDGRPNPSFPALSVGDVVSCRDGDVAGSLTVELMGFAPVEPPVFAPEPEHAVYRRKVGN